MLCGSDFQSVGKAVQRVWEWHKFSLANRYYSDYYAVIPSQ